MQQTDPYKLNKPSPQDFVEVGDLNENADITNTELNKLNVLKAPSHNPQLSGDALAPTPPVTEDDPDTKQPDSRIATVKYVERKVTFSLEVEVI